MSLHLVVLSSHTTALSFTVRTSIRRKCRNSGSDIRALFYSRHFFYPVGGYIADHQGRVKLVGAATYLFGASFLLFVFAWDWKILAFASFLQNFVLFYLPALYALTADSVPIERSGTGFALLLAIPGALGIVGPYIGGYLISIYGLEFVLRVCYAIGFFAGIVVATLRTFTLKETLLVTSQTASFKHFPKLIKESYQSFWTTLK